MAKKSKPSQPAPPPDLSEDTLIMDPDSSHRTQQMTNVQHAALEETQILSAGEVESLPGTPELSPAATQMLDPKVVPPGQVEVPQLPQPSFLSSFPEEEARPSRPLALWIGLGAAGLLLLAGIWYFDQEKPTTPTTTGGSQGQETLPASVPPGYQETLRQAQAGDVAAMRTLGAVYTYGLGVPPHRQEGLRWYRKAAEAGSAVAAEEAKALEGPARP